MPLQPPCTAAIAQLGERQTEDLKVPGSIPGLGMRAEAMRRREALNSHGLAEAREQQGPKGVQAHVRMNLLCRLTAPFDPMGGLEAATSGCRRRLLICSAPPLVIFPLPEGFFEL